MAIDGELQTAASDPRRSRGTPATTTGGPFFDILRGFRSALIEVDHAGRVVAANDRFCEMVGRSPSEVIGAETPHPWWPEDQHGWFSAQMGDRLEYALERGRFDGVFVDRHERRLDVVGVTSLVSSVDGPRLAIAIHESSAAARAGEALRENAEHLSSSEPQLEQVLRRLFDSGIIGIISGQENRILDANDAFLDMIGYSRDDLDRNHIDWVELTPPEWREVDAVSGQEMFRTGSSGPIEKQYLTRQGGRVWVRVAGAVVQWEPFRWVSFVDDVNDRHLVEQERDRLIEQLAETNQQLETALESRIVIEQAKGRVSGEQGISVDEAFASIRRCARRRSMRLRELAQQIVEGRFTLPADACDP